MCGIAGYIDKTGSNKPQKELLQKMTDAISHRGPDAEGHWLNERVALGHRRLSIIDLNVNSNQPMISHDGKYIIVFNGEIYNYIELRNELKAMGAKFRTKSDTEVIMEAYRYYGTDCINRFNGMWAFVLYDREHEQIVMSRDRFGIKPAYILDNDDVFAFASEAKALLAAFPDENIPNEKRIYRYLSGSLNEDVDAECFYKNIKIFRPAKYMLYDLKSNSKKYIRYWEIDEQLFYDKWIRGRNPVKIFQKLFESAVGLRLRADVEVGACLSGGLDSSAIVGCVSKKYKKKIHTFSSVYQDKTCNEEYYIQKVNEKWNTIPHYVRPDDYENNFVEFIKKITLHHDGPCNGASLYSQYMVMQEVGKHVKVVLDGQGADELFAGYIPYYSSYILDLIERGTLFSKCKAIRLLTIVRKEWSDIPAVVSTDVIVKLVGLKNSFLFRNEDRIKEVKMQRKMPLFSEDFMKGEFDDIRIEEIKCRTKLNTKLCNDVINKSIPSLLHNEDGNSMAFSIESRVPFLDYRMVEFAIALDGRYKIKNQWTKWIIRKACRTYLPKEVVKRKNKMGFPAPFARWLREGNCKEEIKQLIYDFAERNIVPKETIDAFYRAHMSGEADFSNILFKFFNMEIWLRTL